MIKSPPSPHPPPYHPEGPCLWCATLRCPSRAGLDSPATARLSTWCSGQPGRVFPGSPSKLGTAQAIARFSRNVGWSLSLPLLVWLPGQRQAGPGWAALLNTERNLSKRPRFWQAGEKQRNWSSSSGPAPSPQPGLFSDKSLHEGWRQHPSSGGGTRVPAAALTWFGHQGWHWLPGSPLNTSLASRAAPSQLREAGERALRP